MKLLTPQTRILFVDKDEISFQIWQCIASALEGLPPIELFHATDPSDGLSMLEDLKPDVIVINLSESAPSEHDVLLENLFKRHTPVVIQTNEQFNKKPENENVYYVERGSSLDSIHKTLLTAASAAKTSNSNPSYH